ncbi:MAG: hypothetical protein AAFP02_22025 [Bacteroidota bacterium]
MKTTIFFSLLLSLITLPEIVLAGPGGYTYQQDSVTESSTIYLLRPVEVWEARLPPFQIKTNMGYEFTTWEGNMEKMLIHEPGELVIDARCGMIGKDQFVLNVEAGKTYYLMVRMQPLVFVDRPIITEVEASYFEIEKQRLASQGIGVE